MSTVGKPPLRSGFEGKCQNGFWGCQNDENEAYNCSNKISFFLFWSKVHNFFPPKIIFDIIERFEKHLDAPDALIVSDEEEEEEDTKLFNEISAKVETANDNAKDNAYFINIDIEKTNEISITIRWFHTKWTCECCFCNCCGSSC